MKKLIKWVAIGLVVVLALIQFANPARTNPPVVPGQDLFATNPPPAKLVSLLRASCYDCHSHETYWPWYSRVAPASWFVADHVKDGRKHLNFSEWPHDNPKRARSRWQNIRDEIESGGMPLRSYTLVHADARLSAADKAALIEWAEAEAKRLSTLLEAEASP